MFLNSIYFFFAARFAIFAAFFNKHYFHVNETDQKNANLIMYTNRENSDQNLLSINWMGIELNHLVHFPPFFTQETIWAISWQKQQNGTHDKTNKMACERRAKTQISLGIRPVWSESSLCAQWVAKNPSCLLTDSEDSDQTGRTPMLIWVFARRTAHLLVLSCAGSFMWFSACFPVHKTPFEKRSTLKGKNFFPFKVDPLQKRGLP